MVEQTKLIIINDNYEQSFSFDKNQTNEIVFLVLPEHNIDIKSIFNLNNENDLKVKVIILNYDKFIINANFSANFNGHGNKTELDILTYGLDSSNTNVVSNFNVVNNTCNNIVSQSIKGILLSDKSKITGEPNLKIDTLDVKAKHSLSIGSLNKEEVFYLMAKGFDLIEVRKILINAYLQSIIKSLNEEDQNKCNNLINEKLGINYEY